MAGGGEGETTLEFTPTWIIAGVCTVIVGISLIVERLIHFTGQYLKKKNQKPLFEALQKVKEELMLLGFISLLLTVFQSAIVRICVKESLTHHLLPCKLPAKSSSGEESSSSASGHRRLLAEGSEELQYCPSKEMHGQQSWRFTFLFTVYHKVQLVSVEALHHLHIFIFVLAVVHVTFCVLAVIFGGAKIRQWKHWEDSISENDDGTEHVSKQKVTHVQQHEFIKGRFLGFGKISALTGWVHAFFKQFYGSITKSDYRTMRKGFIMTHSRGNPKFNFHKYMIRALEDDFKEVVGISWYLWAFVVIFLLLNINGWHTYFWMAFIPFILLLAVGTKLEHVITELAHEVAEKNIAIEGELIVKPSDDYFWFHRPRIILYLIHFVQFQNSFEMAFFFWIWVQYGFDSCIMENLRFIIPRVVIGVIIQVLCSYSTLPLYAIVTQMGSCFKKAIFDDHMHAHIVGWAEKAKRKKQMKAVAGGSGERDSTNGSKMGILLQKVGRKGSAPDEIQPTTGAQGGNRSADAEGV